MAIDQYFDKGNIAPSPWTDSTTRKFVLPRTPGIKTNRRKFHLRSKQGIELFLIFKAM